MRNSGCEVPAWMLSLKAPTQKEKKQLKRRPVERKDVSASTGSIGGGTGSRKKKRKVAAKANKGAHEKSSGKQKGPVERESDYSRDDDDEEEEVESD